jgi:hypothetical protein
MVQTSLPKCSQEQAETGCCPRFDPNPWDQQEFRFQDRLFVRDRTFNFLHIPLKRQELRRGVRGSARSVKFQLT